MTDAKPPRDQAATEGTWAMPLLALAPAAAIRLFTGLSTPWFVMFLLFCALSAALLAAGWNAQLRHGTRGTGVWVTCVLAHLVLVIQILALFRG